MPSPTSSGCPDEHTLDSVPDAFDIERIPHEIIDTSRYYVWLRSSEDNNLDLTFTLLYPVDLLYNLGSS